VANLFSRLLNPQPKGFEQKFTPLDPSVNWQYINHLVYTANTVSYSTENQGDGNSAVFACLRALSYAYIEAPLRVYQMDRDGEREPLSDSPMIDLFDDPHPELDLWELNFWSSWARHADGNAYLLKVRAGDIRTGNVIELWPVPPNMMRPHTERGSRNFIDWYELDRYTSDGQPEKIPVENVIHFKLGVDPMDTRKGLSPLKRLVREISSDAEATKFTDALLKNFGIPGLVAKLPSETMLSEKQIDQLKESISREFSGEARGRVGVLSGGADMTQFGFSPDQLNMKILHDVPETRIAAVMGVDPLVARLGVGLEQTSNYASARQVRENFTELTIIPLWTMDDAKWNRKLKVDFTQDRTITIAHDLSKVRSLQEDENEKFKRVIAAVAAGILTREDGRQALGYDPDIPDNEHVFVPTAGQWLEGADAVTDPEQERQQALAEAEARKPAVPIVNPSNASKDANLFAQVAQAVVDEAAPRFAEDLARLQRNQHRRITARLVNGTQ